MPRGGAPANKPHKTDDDNDDWCAVCKMKGDLLMCDACCLSSAGLSSAAALQLTVCS